MKVFAKLVILVILGTIANWLIQLVLGIAVAALLGLFGIMSMGRIGAAIVVVLGCIIGYGSIGYGLFHTAS